MGKSTILRRQIRALLSSGWAPRRILNLDVELAGPERGATVVATGSHTRHRREGGERLPGRRGGGGVLITRDVEGQLGKDVYALPAVDVLARLDAPALGVARL